MSEPAASPVCRDHSPLTPGSLLLPSLSSALVWIVGLRGQQAGPVGEGPRSVMDRGEGHGPIFPHSHISLCWKLTQHFVSAWDPEQAMLRVYF